jgi:hypothetical protein
MNKIEIDITIFLNGTVKLDGISNNIFSKDEIEEMEYGERIFKLYTEDNDVCMFKSMYNDYSIYITHSKYFKEDNLKFVFNGSMILKTKEFNDLVAAMRECDKKFKRAKELAKEEFEGKKAKIYI